MNNTSNPGELKNPIAFEGIQDLLAAVLNVVVIISVPIVIYFLIYSGFLYVTAQGNPEALKKASRSLMYGVIGGVIIIGSVAIITIIDSLANSFK